MPRYYTYPYKDEIMVKNRRKRTSKTGVADIQSILQNFIEKKAPSSLNKGIQLQVLWENIASEQELKHTDNVVFSPKAIKPTILIYVDDNAWAANLTMNKEMYRLYFSKELNQTINEVVFLVTRNTALKKEFKKNERQKPSYIEEGSIASLSGEELRHARKLVLEIPDKELRIKLFNALIKDSEWKKGIKRQNKP
jgi:hypothetical protein